MTHKHDKLIMKTMICPAGYSHLVVDPPYSLDIKSQNARDKMTCIRMEIQNFFLLLTPGNV